MGENWFILLEHHATFVDVLGIVEATESGAQSGAQVTAGMKGPEADLNEAAWRQTLSRARCRQCL